MGSCLIVTRRVCLPLSYPCRYHLTVNDFSFLARDGRVCDFAFRFAILNLTSRLITLKTHLEFKALNSAACLMKFMFFFSQIIIKVVNNTQHNCRAKMLLAFWHKDSGYCCQLFKRHDYRVSVNHPSFYCLPVGCA